jgi:hypothetical protein
MFHQRHFGITRLGRNDPFSVERWPWKAQSVSILTMTSSSFMVVLEVDWAAVACWRGPWGANVFLLDVSSALKGASASLEGASASLEGAFTFITA